MIIGTLSWSDIVTAVDQFHTVHTVEYCSTSRIQAMSRPQSVWPLNWSGMSERISAKRKNRIGQKKNLMLRNARKLRAIYTIGPEDKALNETLKNARKRLEVHMDSATMPGKLRNTSRNSSFKAPKHPQKKTRDEHQQGEIVCNQSPTQENIQKCLRMQMRGSRVDEKAHNRDSKQKIMRITFRGFNYLNHYNLVHKPIPLPQAMKISDAKAAVDKEWDKLKNIPSWQESKVKSRHEVIDKAHAHGLVPSRKLNWTRSSKHRKDVLCHVRDAAKDDSGVCSVHGAGILRVTHDSRQSSVMDIISRLPGCAGQASDAASAYTQVKMEDVPQFLGLPESECPQLSGFVYHSPAARNHGTKFKIQWNRLEEMCTDTHWQDCCGRNNLTRS